MSTQLLEPPVTHDAGRAITSITRSGRFSRKLRVEWPRAGSWITFDSTYEYDYWLLIRHRAAELGIAHIVRNTTKLPFTEPVEYTAGNGQTYLLNAYRPDFLLLYLDGRTEWVEIKGWQNAKHEATRAALLEHYPHLHVELVTKGDLMAAQREWANDIEGWVTVK